MKKIFYILLVLLSFVFIAGCNEEQKSPTNSIDLSGVVFNDVEVSYDGSEHSIYVVNLPEGIKVVYEGNGVKTKGPHVVTAKLYDSNNNLIKELSAIITVVNPSDADLPLV